MLQQMGVRCKLKLGNAKAPELIDTTLLLEY